MTIPHLEPVDRDIELAVETRHQLSLLPTEDQIAVRRYVAGIPGHIGRLALVLSICLVGILTTQNTSLALIFLTFAVGAATALQSNCKLLRLMVVCGLLARRNSQEFSRSRETVSGHMEAAI